VLEHIAGGTAVTGAPPQAAIGGDPHDLLILESSQDTGWSLTSVRDQSLPTSAP